MNLNQKMVIKLVWISFAIFLFHLVVFSNRIDATTYECDSASSCSADLVSAVSGDEILVNQSFGGVSDTYGFVFNNKDNITFDCGGYNITSSGAGYAFYVNSTGNSNLIIKNCNLSGFSSGVYIYSASNISLDHLITSRFNIVSSNNTNIDYSAAENGLSYGFVVSGINTSIKNSVSLSSSSYGLYLLNSNGGYFENLTLYGGLDDGVRMISNNPPYSYDNIINNSNISNNGGYGIISSSLIPNFTISGTVISNNSLSGIHLPSFESIDVKDSRIYDNAPGDVGFGAYSDFIMKDWNFTNVTGSGGWPINIYNQTMNIKDKTFSELILSGDNSILDNVTIAGSSSKNNNYLFLINSKNLSVKNVVSSGNYYGIILSNITNSTFEDITTNSNLYYGFYIDLNSAYNKLTSLTSSSNILSGLLLQGSNYNLLNNSYLFNNSDSGMEFIVAGKSTYPLYNSIYNNFFNNNVNYHTSLSGLTNYFNTTNQTGTNLVGGSYLGGNYWAHPNETGFSETCTDANSDGICDSAYTLSDGVSVDYLPLFANKSSLFSTLSVVSPVSGSTVSSSPVLFNITSSNFGLTSCSYSLDSAANMSMTKSGSYQSATESSVSEGNHQVEFYCTNVFNLESYKSVNFTFSTYTEVTVPSGGGGGGGTVPGGGSTTSTTIITGISTDAGVPYSVNINNPLLSLTFLSFTPSQSLTDASINVSTIKSVPQADLKVSGTGLTYESFQILTSVINDSNIGNVSIGFKVNKSWISDNNFLTSQISLYRNTGNNKWTELNTTLTSNDSQYYYFTGFSPGFSNYTIFARVPECNFGDLRCHDSNLELCNSQSSWEVSQECQYGCSNLACQDNPAPPTPKNLVQNVIDNFKQNKAGYLYDIILALILAGAGVYIYFFYRYLRQIYPQNKIWKKKGKNGK